MKCSCPLSFCKISIIFAVWCVLFNTKIRCNNKKHNTMENYSTTTRVIDQSAVATLFKSTYLQMAAALTVTALTAYFLPQLEIYWSIFTHADGTFNSTPMWLAFAAEFGVVIWLSARLFSMSMTKATLLFILYSVLNGVTLSMISLIYDPASILIAFAVTGGMFLVMSLIGYIARMDLSRLGSVFMMLLMGIIIGTVVQEKVAPNKVNQVFEKFLHKILFCLK